MNRYKYLKLFSILMLCMTCVISCSTSEVLREIMDPEKYLSTKTKLDLKIQGQKDLNPNFNGRPSPVVVRLYTLVSPSIFENSDFISLYHNDMEVLGSDFIRKEEKDFEPSEYFEAQLELSERANFIGLVAAYQDIERAQWRLVLPMERGKHNHVFIKLTSDSVIQVKDE